ncbi:succinate-semialdehyde dehydrogenase [Myxozyma melibiosi]|uniref:Succinate-semialdehyde dehydrogenase n=1 Tax=Myxozyma melibiosi TaxID=54550 RepID=A0ABR1FDF1_9ASCO
MQRLLASVPRCSNAGRRAVVGTSGIRSVSSAATRTLDALEKLKKGSLYKEAGIIGGEEVTLSKTFEVLDPATLQPVAQVPDLGLPELDRAISAASTAFSSFSTTTTAFERAAMLNRWHALVMANQDELAALITLENGKPLAEAKGEVAYAASFMSWFAGEAPRAYGDVLVPSVAGHRAITIKQPVGVVGILTPWNFPAAMITRKTAAAVAAGCSVVIKPDAETPLTAIALAKLALEAGIPPGVINVVPTKSALAEVGRTLCEDVRLRKLSFTGSTAVGQLLMAQSASSLKKLSFELGGNAPFIVFEDVDIDAAVAAAVLCKFRGSGQTCVCANRMYVHASVYDEFVQKLTEVVKGFKLGSGFDAQTTHGPLIHARAIEKVERHVADAVAKGARVEVGGERASAEVGPHFYAPTIVSGATSEMAVAREETFGPLAAVFKFETEEEVVRQANESDVGLASYVFTKNIARVMRVAEKLEYGMVGVNTGIISDCAAPFGGVKFSGFGREGSKYGLDEYLTVKAVTIGGGGW